MPRETAGSISMLTDEDESCAGERGVFANSVGYARRVVALQVDELSSSLSDFCEQVRLMVDKVNLTRGFALESIELQVELTAKGEVRLIGSASTEAKGGLKLLFRRKTDEL